MTGASGPQVFISYRRRDTGDLVPELAERLRGDLGSHNVFRDVDSLIAGQPWRETLDEAVRSSDVTVCLVGPAWARGPQGEYDIDDPDDPVAMEVGAALRGSSPVPVLVDLPEPPANSAAAALFEHHAVGGSRTDLLTGDVYQSILVGAWEALRAKVPNGVLILSESTAEVDLGELVAELKSSRMISARNLSRLAAGVHVASGRRLRKWARRLPDVIVYAEQSPSADFAGRIKAATAHPSLERVTILGAGAAIGLAIAGQVGTLTSATTVTAHTSPAAMAADSANSARRTAVAAARSWSALGTSAKAATAAGALVLAGGGAAVTLLGDDDFSLPRSGDYGVLTFEVAAASIDADHPQELLDDDDHDYLALDISIRNRLRDRTFEVPVDVMRVEYDGENDAGFLADGRALTVDPLDDTAATVFFPIEEGKDLGDLALVVAEDGFHPLRLPLRGSGPVAERVDLDIASIWSTPNDAGLELTLPLSAWRDFNTSVVDGSWAIETSRGCGERVSTLGRAARGISLLHLTGEAAANPRSGVTAGLGPVELASSIWGIPVVATIDGAPTLVCDGFGPLVGRTPGELQIIVPADGRRLLLRAGCPCGTVNLTPAEPREEHFRLEADVTG